MNVNPESDRYVSLATFRRDGREVRTPVWIAGQGDYFYLFSEGEAGKVKRIRANGMASLAACTFKGDVLSDWAPFKARIVEDADEVARAYLVLQAKYGWQMRLTNWMSRLAGRYEKRAVIALEPVAEQ